MDESGASFGDRLRRSRRGAGLSQEELAERSGLSRRGISDLERGARRAPRLETARMLADGLALDGDDRAAFLAAGRVALRQGDPVARVSPLLGSLPTTLTRLIGREAEVHALRIVLRRDDVRLVTLTGAGGTGKTRLAIAVAAELHDAFPDGIFFVDLSPLTDPDLVVPTIAAVLGVREVAGQRLIDTLSTFLAPKRVLLLLDNCERVLPATPDIITLVATSPLITILATSREPFRVRGEREFPVPPLPVPTGARLPAVPALAQIPAVALFVERTTGVQPDFALGADNAVAVAAICQRLDGLPLAIELAAARVKVLSPEAVLKRLEPRLPLLTGGGRDLPARQRTMRDTIAWSYDQLSSEGQAFFRRLAVFAGGFTLVAAEAVAVPNGTHDVLAGVAALVDSSLLGREADLAGEPRFRISEMVREYGLEQLAISGETDDVRERHAGHFLRFAESLMHGSPLFVNLESAAVLTIEHDNLRLALAWFDERAEIDALLRLSTALYGLWLTRGPYCEGLQWIRRALEQSPPMASGPRIEALVAMGRLETFRGDYTRAATFIAEGLTLAREIGDPLLIGRTLTSAGLLSYRRGDYGQAEELLDEALHMLRGVGDSVPDAVRETGLALRIRGDTALAQGQFERAATRYEEAFEVLQAVGSVWGAIDARAGLAGVNYCTGNRVRAAALYLDSLDRARDLGITLLVASSLLGLAGVAAESGHRAAGARLLGAAEEIVASLGAPLFPRDRPIRDRCLAALKAELGEERLAAAREVGRSVSVEEAMAEAREVARAVTESATALYC